MQIICTILVLQREVMALEGHGVRCEENGMGDEGNRGDKTYRSWF